MSKESDEFEKTIAEVYRLLVTTNEQVTWNDTVPDPDNPSQPRQIDISIKNDSFVTHIECRMHRNKQDVKWIEELYGRRKSLGVNALIAVSSSGFTSGAIIKAKRFNIEIRDTISLRENEIVSWGKLIAITTIYIAFDDLSVECLLDISEITKDNLEVDTRGLLDDLQGFVNDFLSFICNKFLNLYGHLSPLDIPPGEIDMPPLIKEINPPLYIGDYTMSHIAFATKGLKLVHKNLYIHEAILFGNPNEGIKEREISIQKFMKDGGEYIDSPASAKLSFNLLNLDSVDNSVFIGLVINDLQKKPILVKFDQESRTHNKNYAFIFRIGCMPSSGAKGPKYEL